MQLTSDIFEFVTTERRDPPAPPVASPGTWATHAIRASDLQGKAFEPLRYVLPGLIPEGATLLVSRPKLGKSWLALDLCIAIAADRAALGSLQPAVGDVLYLALEDGERRLQRRMATLLPNANAWPSRLTLATRWRRANDGGLADIRD
jgi:AAA domain